MFAKVAKHVFLGTSRIMLFIFGAALLLCALAQLALFAVPRLSTFFAAPLTFFVSVISVIVPLAVPLLTLCVLLFLFYRDMLSQKSQLTFTLPVGVHTHIFVRFVTHVFYIAASIAVSVCGAFMVGYFPFSRFFLNLFSFEPSILPSAFLDSLPETLTETAQATQSTIAVLQWETLSPELKFSILSTLALLLFALLIGIFASAYAAFAVGASFRRIKLGASAFSFLLLRTGVTAATFLLTAHYAAQHLGADVHAFVDKVLALRVVGAPLETLSAIIDMLYPVAVFFILINVVFLAVQYLITFLLFKFGQNA